MSHNADLKRYNCLNKEDCETLLWAKGTWRDRSIPDIWEEKARNTAHPHSKPIQLQKRLILATTAPSDVIVDPCAGSYSTLRAVQDLGDRYFLGCDILPAEASSI